MNCNIKLIAIVFITLLVVLNHDILTNSVSELLDHSANNNEKQQIKKETIQQIENIEKQAIKDAEDEDTTQVETEGFTNYVSAHLIEKDPRKTTDPDCPFISFYQSDKDYYCASSDTFYNCVNATPGSYISPYDAAFSVVGGYLGSLPDTSPNKMRKCASQHRDVIRNWNLCDGKQLQDKQNYNSLIQNKEAKDRFLKVNYADNKSIVDAINYAC